MSPYRIPAERKGESKGPRDHAPDACPDLDLLPVLIQFWLASVARVVVFLLRHEVVQLDVTLAWLAVLFVPFLLQDSARYVVRRLTRAVRRRA